MYRPDWMRKPNWVVNDCRETDADEEQDDDRSRARLQRPLVSMMRVYAALGPTSNVVVETRPFRSKPLPGDLSVIAMLQQFCFANLLASCVKPIHEAQ